jgi:hypothetical protein
VLHLALKNPQMIRRWGTECLNPSQSKPDRIQWKYLRH